MKIWICGSVSAKNEEENISELVKTFEYFDGAVFNINYNNIEDCRTDLPTYFMLDKYKKEGKILLSPWIKRHDYAMNVFLKAGIIKRGDWFIFVDAQELLKVEFLINLKGLILDCENKGIGAVYWNRPYLCKYYDHMQFAGNPHAWLNGIVGKHTNIADESKVVYDSGGVHFGNLLYNKKKRENALLLSGIKYSLYDSPNNQFSMFYKDKELEQHEFARQQFCLLLESKGYERNLDGLEQFFKNKNNLTEDIQKYLNWEHVFNSFYRYKILGENLDEIIKNRYDYKIEF
jgi:hypothetical protein